MRRSGFRTREAFYSKTAYPLEGSFIGLFYIRSRFGDSTAIGRTEVLRASLNIKELIERAKTQAVFKHLNDQLASDSDDRQGWARFYSQSDDVVQDTKRVNKFSDDIGDDIEIKLVDYIFEYPKFGSRRKFKSINVKGKRYLQVFEKRDNRYVYSQRFGIKGRTSATRRNVNEI